MKLLHRVLIVMAVVVSATGRAAVADDAVPGGTTMLVVRLSDAGDVLYPLSDALALEPKGNGKVLSVMNGTEVDEYDLGRVVAIGFMTVDNPPASIGIVPSASEILEADGPWSIYSAGGVAVSRGESGRPDLSGLKSGQVYLIKTAGGTLRYAPCVMP